MTSSAVRTDQPIDNIRCSEQQFHDLAGWLRDSAFMRAQHVPKGSHPAWLRENLPCALENESRLLELNKQQQPISFDFSICPEFYATQQGFDEDGFQVLNFLQSGSVIQPSKLPESLWGICRSIVETNSEGMVALPFAIHPMLDLIAVTDRDQSNSENLVHLGLEGQLFALWLREQPDLGSNLIEVGTGSGLVSLALAHRTGASVLGIEINPRAFQVTNLNIHMNHLEAVTRVALADFNAFETDSQFDCVITNPPYMLLPGEHRITAYSGGGKWGLDFPEQIVKRFQNIGQRLIMLIGAPIVSGRNVFDDLLSEMDFTTIKHTLRVTPLSGISSFQRHYLELGASDIELAAYDIR